MVGLYSGGGAYIRGGAYIQVYGTSKIQAKAILPDEGPREVEDLLVFFR